MHSKMLLLAGVALCLVGQSAAAASPEPPLAAEPALRRTLTVTTTETIEGLGKAPDEKDKAALNTLAANCEARSQKHAWQGWTKGGEYQRAEALDSIRQLRNGGSIAQVENASDCLKRYYGLRAGRQQTALDAESGMVFFGAVGSLASVNAGATTQAYWNYAAILPVVVAEFNANEPTRDLYAGARIGLDIVAGRYLRLAVLTDILEKNTGASSSRKTVAHIEGCNALKALKPVEDWASGEDKTAMLPDYRKLRQACDNATFMDLGLQGLCDAAVAWRTSYSSAYARDLLRLDDEILNKDRDLRYSPIETLSAMAAAPFTAAATLLSGENGSKAVDRLKTQRVFSALNVPLEPINLPPPPAPMPDYLVVGDAALARPAAALAAETAAPKLSAKAAAAAALVQPRKPTAQEVQVMLNTLQAAAKGLNTARGDLNNRLMIANRIATLAAYDRLDFNYDANTARISVVLATTAPPPLTSPLAGR